MCLQVSNFVLKRKKKLYIFHSAPWIWIFRSFKMGELRIQYGFLHDLTNAKSTGNLEFREGLVRKYSAVKRLICCRGTTWITQRLGKGRLGYTQTKSMKLRAWSFELRGRSNNCDIVGSHCFLCDDSRTSCCFSESWGGRKKKLCLMIVLW